MRDLVDRILRHVPGVVLEQPELVVPTIEIQQRLARLAAEINALDRPGREFAEGHHERAARLAYQQTLDEASRLLGLPVEEPGPTHRLVSEARLMHAGWRW